ncbi:MAG: beta-lactamase family protein [Chitinophagaceae bacterium]|nr:beta-lactamase family protein [Chitinophagaceae bacterium]
MNKRFFLLLTLQLIFVSVFAQKADEFDSYIKSFMKNDSVPGASFLVVKKGKIVKSGVYGYSNLELKVEAKQESVWELASVSKPITATCIMKLVEEGKINLDSSIYFYLGDAVTEKYRSVTIRQIMSHTGSIPSDHFVYTKLYAPTPIRYTVKEQLNDLFKLAPVGKPGGQFLYSNASFFLQAAIIEKVTSISFKDFVQQTIFEKAGMNHTYCMNGDSLIYNRSQVYTKRKGVWVRFSLETSLQALDANGFGGLMSTTNDLNLFIQALLAGKLISNESLKQMLTITKLNDGTEAGPRSSKIGLGWFIKDIDGKTCVSHSGHTGTVLLFYPKEELTIVFLSNLSAGISMLGDKGFRVGDMGFVLARMAMKKYGDQQQ